MILVLVLLLVTSACGAPEESPPATMLSTIEVLPPTATLRPTSTIAPTRPIDTAVPDMPTPTATMTLILDTATPTVGIGSTTVSEKDGMTQMYIPTGPFLMGSDANDILGLCQKFSDYCEMEWFTNDEPPHTVILDAFWIDQTEVTNAMYNRCVLDGSCRLPYSMRSKMRRSYYLDPQYADFPVIYISWNDAEAYCHWANRRLPTEAEWEKAARGTDGQLYPWGNQQPTCDLANLADTSDYCVGDTVAVGSYPNGASPYGVLDMAGNVEEWIKDFYDPNYYRNAPATNPPGPPDPGMPDNGIRIVRGSSWWNPWIDMRPAFRFSAVFTQRNENIGFRCAASAGG